MNLYQQFTSFLKRKIFRISRDRWNHQYQSGRWSSLHQEEDRLEAVTGLLQARQKPLALLEIGCGDAVLFRKLPSGIYSRFTGADISDVAIASAKAFEQEGVHFLVADMNTYQPSDRYDAVIFNESLYYAKEPLQVLKRFESALLPEGRFIITAIDNKYTAGFWAPIMQAYDKLTEQEVRAGEMVWNVKEIRPQSDQ